MGISSTSPSQKLSVAGRIYSASGGFQFPDGSVQTSAAVSPPTVVFTSRYGSGRRCVGDAWVSACTYMPGYGWNYNMCLSRGHAATYGWTVQWHPEVNGYQQAGYGEGWPLDVVCDI